ncbi:MAG TPA: hypothetical protein VF584_18455 [Longimicrobium sp.]|jgi:hypothetical protein
MLSRAIPIILAAALLASCDDPTGPLPREGAPREFEYSVGGFAVGSGRVELHGDTVVLVRTPWDARPGTRPDSIRTVPSAEAWRAFWKAAADAGVRRWRPRYMAEGIVDGGGWSLRIVAPGAKIESNGSNAYPDRHGLEHEGEAPNEFRALEDAIEALAGAPLYPVADTR